jgi:hypothetical protein
MKPLGALLLTGLFALPAGAHATDISGLWQISTTFRAAPVVMDCNVLQVGVQLSGWCEPESPDAVPAALTGQLDQTRATWGYDVNDSGRTVRLAYSGLLTGSLAMSGTLSAGGVAAPFTASRK